MTTATNIEATAVNTLSWLASLDATIVVPVYQRQYRWDIGGCEQLLSDVRAVADSDPHHMHFIGSVLSSTDGDGDDLVLIDGQQRITTLMLLIAALHHTVQHDDTELASVLERVLTGPDGRTKLRPHEAWADVFESVVFDDRPADGSLRDSRFDDNYAFFRSKISRGDAAHIWRGLQKLEHVAITLGAGANAQQIFASLNSTGEPLRDHELIHNYVLMGLSHAQQRQIEEEFWLPIERNTGASIAAFWRHYMVMLTGREVAASGDHGVYGEFRSRFPRLDVDTLRRHAAHWRASSEVYRTLLEPESETDAELSQRLRQLAVVGKGMNPLVMRALMELRSGEAERETVLRTLDAVQTLLLRRAVAGLPLDRLVARLCRARDESESALTAAIARITPSDERMRAALRFAELPHPAYVLARLAGIEDSREFAVDHIAPLSPAATWSGDGERVWADYTDDEQNSHRALAKTLGNLALLEDELALRVLDASFVDKRDRAYARSAVAQTRALADVGAWDTTGIAARARVLTERFIEVWPRADIVGIDDDGLTPVLDAVLRRGFPPGWQREFAYVEYRGEHWEVPDVKYLFNRIFKRLWADDRDSVVRFSARRGGPVYGSKAWNGQWDALDEAHFLYMGWDLHYMLSAVQGVLGEAGFAPEVFVKYSYIGNAM
ncbi:DUF262 domain-containing protein [Microbacterium sp. NPDC064584]|uniref:GmrSD restriction endonuclease domain-containing protein n=1 Tax=Microbacterium sp. NPDC064584 TaxID=3155817 RepID=UPI00342D5F97